MVCIQLHHMLLAVIIQGQHAISLARLGSSSGTDSCNPFVTDPAQIGNTDTTMLGLSGGPWSACTHLKTYGLNFAPFFARFLTYQLAPQTVLEFGCGLGTTSDYIARAAGARVTCIEPDSTLGSLIASLRKDNRGEGTLTQLAINTFADGPSEQACVRDLASAQHDLVFSLEVAEHIPFRFHPQLIDLLTSSTKKWLVFSAARPGQGGTGHLNESSFTSDEWRSKFEAAGMVYMPKLTYMARQAAYYKRSYDLFANTLVFKKQGHVSDDTDQPHEMLAHFMYGGLDSDRTEKQYPKKDANRYNAAAAFAEGSNSALWPALALMEQKANKGILCSEHTKSLTLLAARKHAFTSGWAAHFYENNL